MKETKYDKIVHYILENQEKFYRLAFSYVKNREDALDAVQNAICKALEHSDSLQNEDAIRTWFYRIQVNESLLILRKRQDERLPDEEDGLEIPYHEKGFDPENDFSEQLNQLEEETQTIIKLRYFEELSLKEIAEITELNLNTVKAKLYRGLKQLKQTIKEEDL